MTAIVALFDGRETWIASDGNVFCDNFRTHSNDSKVLEVGPWTVAMAGQAFAVDVLATDQSCISAESALAFCAAARDALKAVGLGQADENQRNAMCFGVSALLARPGEL